MGVILEKKMEALGVSGFRGSGFRGLGFRGLGVWGLEFRGFGLRLQTSSSWLSQVSHFQRVMPSIQIVDSLPPCTYAGIHFGPNHINRRGAVTFT